MDYIDLDMQQHQIQIAPFLVVKRQLLNLLQAAQYVWIHPQHLVFGVDCAPIFESTAHDVHPLAELRKFLKSPLWLSTVLLELKGVSRHDTM